MSASEQRRAEWLGPGFWDRLDRLQCHHQRIQSEHDAARRSIERLPPHETEELRQAWHRYCEVVAELDRTAAEFGALHSGVE
jgi:hypothetical protein